MKIDGKLGLRAQDTAEIFLDGVRVPDSARLGDEGAGFKVAMSALDNGRISLAAGSVGIAQGCVDASIAYAAERRQFGKPIAAFQLVQELIADMAVETEAARMLAWRAAFLADSGQPYTLAASQAKYYASEVAVRAANAAVQVHGGYGYVDEFPVQKYLRDARVSTLYEGTSQIQKLLIGRALTGESALHVTVQPGCGATWLQLFGQRYFSRKLGDAIRSRASTSAFTRRKRPGRHVACADRARELALLRIVLDRQRRELAVDDPERVHRDEHAEAQPLIGQRRQDLAAEELLDRLGQLLRGRALASCRRLLEQVADLVLDLGAEPAERRELDASILPGEVPLHLREAADRPADVPRELPVVELDGCTSKPVSSL